MPDENIDVIPDSSTGEGENGSEPVKTPQEGTSSAQPNTEKTVPYERFKQVNDELAKIKSQNKENEQTEEWVASTDPIELAKFSKEASQFSDEEIELATKIAPTKDLDGIRKAFKDPWFKEAVDARRIKVANENKIPSPSSPTGTYSQTDAKKVISEGNVAEEAAKIAAELEAKEGRGGGI